MFNVLIDTCVWLDMAQDPKQTPLLLVVQNMVGQGILLLVVPRVVVEEFKRNRARVAQASARSLKSHVAQVKEAINRVAGCNGQDTSLHLILLKARYPHRPSSWRSDAAGVCASSLVSGLSVR